VKDTNYIKLKNALAKAVEDLLKDGNSHKKYHFSYLMGTAVTTINDQASKDQMHDIQELLRVLYVPEEHHDKLEGSCKWIDDREDFQTWIGAESRDNSARTFRPSIFWVQASPGAGKTVLAAHVISQLRHFRLAHASYFFHLGKNSADSLAGLLQSLALQMASANAAIREKLVELHTIRASFDQDDARAVWMKIFVGGIFQVCIYPTRPASRSHHLH
jgi:hypothetical protein